MKLQNIHHKIRLHSHDVKYGSGSGQQSVTGTDVKEDVNSHWALKGKKSLSTFSLNLTDMLLLKFSELTSASSHGSYE